MADSQKLKTIFPHASSSFLELNRVSSGSKPEQIVCDDALGKTQRKGNHTGRCLIRYTSFRCRFTDPDNLCFKYFTDSLRYFGFIKDDTVEDIKIETSQRKVDHKNQEKTLIEIIYPPG